MGRFDLEESLQAMQATLMTDFGCSMSELSELNSSAETVIKTNQVRRGQNNISSGGA